MQSKYGDYSENFLTTSFHMQLLKMILTIHSTFIYHSTHMLKEITIKLQEKEGQQLKV